MHDRLQALALSGPRLFARISPKDLLAFGNVGLGVVLVLLTARGVLPLDIVHLSFYAFAAFLVALYRPGMAFLFLVGMLPYENINLAPSDFPVMLRPYQGIGLMLGLALLVRLLSGRLRLSFFRFSWLDTLAVLVGVGAFFAVVGAPEPAAAVKQAVVVLSFGFLYFLMRQFLRRQENIAHVEPFFIGSALVVFATALYQAIRLRLDLPAGVVMAERPNATFAEADWLGLYAAFVALWILCRLAWRIQRLSPRGILPLFRELVPAWLHLIALFGALTTLILSVSRSAWLGFVAGLFLFFLVLVWEYLRQYTAGKKVLLLGVVTAAFGLLAAGTVFGLRLTAFDLFDRAASTASGQQTITISCTEERALPETVGGVEELEALGCRHINLEERESERGLGRFVTEIKRPDPNVSIRGSIYKQSIGLIREHALFGIGWGSAAFYLGSDGRGAGLNASNMFLEVWLGSGALGFLAFTLLWFGLFFLQTRVFLKRAPGALLARQMLALFALMTIFNLFNAGLLMALAVFFLALAHLSADSLKSEA